MWSVRLLVPTITQVQEVHNQTQRSARAKVRWFLNSNSSTQMSDGSTPRSKSPARKPSNQSANHGVYETILMPSLTSSIEHEAEAYEVKKDAHCTTTATRRSRRERTAMGIHGSETRSKPRKSSPPYPHRGYRGIQLRSFARAISLRDSLVMPASARFLYYAHASYHF